MNNNIMDSIEWHRDQLETLLSKEEFSKIDSGLDEIIEKFRLPGSKDKTKRKSKKGLKGIISDAFGNKDGDDKKSPDPGRPPDDDVDARLRNAARAQAHSRSRSRMR
jgi:hypothetical protein